MPRPNRTDVALALGLLTLYELEALTANVTGHRPTFVVIGLVITLPLLARRRYPLPVIAAIAAAFVANAIAGDHELPPQSSLIALLAAAHTAGAHLDGRAAKAGLAIVFAGILLAEANDFVVLGPLSLGTWAVGRALSGRTREAAGARAAIAEERARIARELHDVVAHGISTMVVQAGAERLALRDERPQTAEVLAGIERSGREALGEMRRLVGLLREADEQLALAPQPSLAHLHGLAESMQRAGLQVELDTDGDLTALPPGLDVSGYRIVQEGLTNALRHAGHGARARVHVRATAGELEIEVADDGPASAAPVASDHGGHGLVGMRERVAIYGGELTAGPSPAGGFVLRTRLPIRAA